MRAVLGVIVSFVIMSTVIFGFSIAPWIALGVDGVLEPGRFDSTAVFNFYAVVVGIAGAFFGGWLCAAIGGSRTGVMVLAGLCFAGGLVNHFGQHHKPEPGARQPGLAVMEAMTERKEPDWFTVLMPCVGVVGVLAGGRRAGRSR